LYTKDNKISSGGNQVRSNRFKVGHKDAKVLNLDPDNAGYIDKNKLKQSFKQMKDETNN
jgi:hypothetical protein